jgi:GDPmannose 4,6-dehydratase
VTVNYREAYGIHASNGILFNHEGERRGENFVTRKITRSAGRIKCGLQDRLYLGNLSAKRDWGYAPDFVEAMWIMLQQDKPDDYVISTGEMHSVEEFCLHAFAEVGINLTFEGVDEDRVGFDEEGRVLVAVNPVYFRPTDVEQLLGDSSKVKQTLGWEPKVKFKELVKLMAAYDLKLAQQEKLLC